MCNNLVHFPNKVAVTEESDDLLIREIRDLIYLFQNPNLSNTTRKAVFNEIIDLTNKLTD